MRKTLLLAPLLVALSCTRNPFTSHEGIGDLPIYETIMPTVDIFSEVNGGGRLSANDRIVCQFSEPMDSASAVSGITVTVYAGAATGVSGSWAYYKETWRAVFTPSADFVDSTTYLVTVPNGGAHDRSGNSVDGNGNGVDDGSPRDDARRPLRGPGPNAPMPDLTPPTVEQVLVWTGTLPLDAYTADTLYVGFPGTDVDPATVSSSSVEFRDLYEVSKGSVTFVYDTTILGNYVAVFYYSGLDSAAVFKLHVVNTIADTAGNFLDGDGDGIAEKDDDFVMEIKTRNPAFPRVSNIAAGTNEVRVRFNQNMATSTFNNTNVKVFADPTASDFIDGRIVADLDGRGFTYMVKQSSPSYWIYISKEVTNDTGLKLDGDGDGFGGEPGEDDVFQLAP